MYQIVSSATPSYYPGIIALWNSILINSPKCKLTVYCYDDTDEYLKLENLGIDIIKNKKLPGPIAQKGHVRPNGGPVNEDMYARLMVSEDFSGKVFYVDADCIILDSIYELWDDLDLEDKPTACVYRMDIGWIGGHIYDDMASGTYLADTEKWRELDITKKCFDAMRDGRIRFSMNVESVLSHIHNRNFIHLDRVYQNLTYYGKLSKEDKVAHFAGNKPWTSHTMNYKQLWEAYYNNNVDKIVHIESALPDKKFRTIHPRERGVLRAQQCIWS